MSIKRVIWGSILIIIGLLFALKNFGVIDFDWFMLFSLWPLILIFVGITLLPMKNAYKIILIIASLIIGIAVVFSTYDENSYSGCNRWHSEEVLIDQDTTVQNLFIPFDSTITRASLEFDAAAGKFSIEGASTNLIDFNGSGIFGGYNISAIDSDSSKNIKLTLENGNIKIAKHKSKGIVRLNTLPLWNMKLSAGVSEINADLSPFKVKDVKIEGGVSGIDIKFGELYQLINISVETGVSSITIRIPKSSGCRIVTEGALNNKDFEGFSKKENDSYETDNLNTANNKIFITIEAGLSHLIIIKY